MEKHTTKSYVTKDGATGMLSRHDRRNVTNPSCDVRRNAVYCEKRKKEGTCDECASRGG